jgi:hypothetical protein
MAVNDRAEFSNSRWDTYRIVPDEEFEVFHGQELVGFENGRTRRVAHQILARCRLMVSHALVGAQACAASTYLSVLLGCCRDGETRRAGSRDKISRMSAWAIRKLVFVTNAYLHQLCGHNGSAGRLSCSQSRQNLL